MCVCERRKEGRRECVCVCVWALNLQRLVTFVVGVHTCSLMFYSSSSSYVLLTIVVHACGSSGSNWK